MSKSSMPVSKAKTAYGLLSEIRKLILEEPKRYDQRVWKRNTRYLDNHQKPACGTVCCVAGWVQTLKTEVPITDMNDWETPVIAAKVLGVDEIVAWKLFGDQNAGGRNDEKPEAHAKRGAAHIAKFQKKYAKQLKAKRV